MAGLKLPQTLVDANIFVDGQGNLGVSKSVQLPKIEKIRNTVIAGGFEQDSDTGVFKKLEAEYIFAEWSSMVISAMAKSDASGSGVSMTIKGSIFQGGVKTAVLISIRGGVDIDDGKMEAGKEIERKVKQFVTFYEMEIGGKQVCSIDTKNMIAIFDGVDYLEELRAHIS